MASSSPTSALVLDHIPSPEVLAATEELLRQGTTMTTTALASAVHLMNQPTPIQELALRMASVKLPDASALTPQTILDTIWDADVNRCSVSDRDDDGTWVDPNADILLDKQSRAPGSADSLDDAAPNPLFHTVKTAAMSGPTYKTFLALMDNYDAWVNNIEYLNDGELDEIDDFLTAILITPAMQAAYIYITQVLKFEFTPAQFKKKMFRMWFELHTLTVDEVVAPRVTQCLRELEAAQRDVEAENERIAKAEAKGDERLVEEFTARLAEAKTKLEEAQAALAVAQAEAKSNDEANANSGHSSTEAKAANDGEDGEALPEGFTRQRVIVRYCSGFEHVFMGEISIPDGEKVGNVLGYHNWMKFYIDELEQLVDFLGTKYQKNSLSKIGAPFVCIKFRWDQDGQVFIKERGSFFVGCSPEFSMAVATCCYFETMTPESARAAGWTEMRDNKYKMRREVGGYIYEYYLCRQKEYLVSCFQELVGPTAATQEMLTERRRIKAEQKAQELFEQRRLAKLARAAAAEAGCTDAAAALAAEEEEETKKKQSSLSPEEVQRRQEEARMRKVARRAERKAVGDKQEQAIASNPAVMAAAKADVAAAGPAAAAPAVTLPPARGGGGTPPAAAATAAAAASGSGSEVGPESAAGSTATGLKPKRAAALAKAAAAAAAEDDDDSDIGESFDASTLDDADVRARVISALVADVIKHDPEAKWDSHQRDPSADPKAALNRPSIIRAKRNTLTLTSAASITAAVNAANAASAGGATVIAGAPVVTAAESSTSESSSSVNATVAPAVLSPSSSLIMSPRVQRRLVAPSAVAASAPQDGEAWRAYVNRAISEIKAVDAATTDKVAYSIAKHAWDEAKANGTTAPAPAPAAATTAAAGDLL